MPENIETVMHKGKILAKVIRTSNLEDTLFFSPEDFVIQASVQNRENGYKVPPHEHPPITNLQETNPQELIYVIKGRVEVGLYLSEEKIGSKILTEGDLILLNSGHDLKYLEDSRILLIKTGPYRGKDDKKLFKQ